MKAISFRNDILPLKNVMYRLALRITLNKEDAEDVVQDALIKIWNRRDEWNTIDNMEAFCLTVCRNQALDKIKKAGNRNAPLEEESQQGHNQTENPYDRIIDRNSVEWVRRLINQLPEKQRSCMQLRDFEGRTYKEIAKVMEISEEQVKINIFRARQTVKKQYQEAEEYGL